MLERHHRHAGQPPVEVTDRPRVVMHHHGVGERGAAGLVAERGQAPRVARAEPARGDVGRRTDP